MLTKQNELKFSWLTFQRYSFKRTSILVRAFSRFTLHTIYCITKYSLHNKQQTSHLHDKQQTSQQQNNTVCKCPWLQANLFHQSKIEPKQFLTIVSNIKALFLQTSIYLRTPNDIRFRRHTMRSSTKRYTYIIGKPLHTTLKRHIPIQ